MLSIAAPIIEQEEIDAVNQVLKSGMLAQGPKVAELEEAFARYCGTKYAVALNSGTAAIHCALHAASVGPGDEVITTPFSFIATINPILMTGATVRLVDIKPSDFMLDPVAVKKAITKKTKAIIGVDLYGQPYDYTELASIARDAKTTLIEDACQAVGAKYGDKMAGSLGDIGCFSLYATKNIMSGEGGVLTTDKADVAESAKRFRQHGMTGPYEYAELGYNYRLTDLLAAIATEQLKKADAFTAARQRNAYLLTAGLKGIKGVITPHVNKARTHVYHQYTLRITKDARLTRDELLKVLKDKGVGAGIYYPKPLHAYPHIARLGFSSGDFPVAELAAQEVISLPVHPRVTEAEIATMVDTIKEILHA